MKERIRFTVTQEHIRVGEKAEPESCPIALALVDARLRGAAVFDHTVFADEGMYRLSARARRFLRAFDHGRPVQPFTGEVYR